MGNFAYPTVAFAAVTVLFFVTSACSDSSKAVRVESGERPLTKFAEEITSDTKSLTLKPGQVVLVPVTVKNLGPEKWSANGAYPVHLSYLWFADGKQLPIDPTRTVLSGDLAPGATQTLQANVAAPPASGKYTLKFTMVQERVVFFSSTGASAFDVACSRSVVWRFLRATVNHGLANPQPSLSGSGLGFCFAIGFGR